MKSLGRIGLLVIAIVIWGVLSPSPARAAGIVGTGSPLSCDSNKLAEKLEGGGIVLFNCGEAPHTIDSATYVIEDNTVIRGGNLITLNGENLRQQFLVADGATLTLEDIILLDGESPQGGCISVSTSGVLNTFGTTFHSCRDVSATTGGGAVYNLGTFHAEDTVFRENRAEEEGGAIFNRGAFNAKRVLFEANTAGDDSGAIENDGDGVVVINESAFVDNSAAGGGGAVGNTLSVPTTSGSFTILRTLFVDNTSTTFGGAINNVTGAITVQNSTFVRNTSNEGGAIFASGSTNTVITFSTFDDNRADTGAAIYRPLLGTVELGYSILAGSRNQADTADALQCDGPPFASRGYNLIEDLSCISGSDSTDIRDTPALLGALQDNGGFSQTELPDADSPALGKAPSGPCPALDQRGAKRRGDCDIGAAERGGLFDSAFMPRVRKVD
jgi:predicted outer membrane repeat protein